MGKRGRGFAKLYAEAFGYFWLPCPKCGKEFGGHELIRGAPATIAYDSSGTHGVMVCPDCRDEMLSRGVCTESPWGDPIMFRYVMEAKK